MSPGNLALRFLLELAALAAFSAWGLRVGTTMGASFALAVFAPLAAGALWGLCVSPRARLSLPMPARLGVELGLFALAVLALLRVGAYGWAWTLAAAVALHQGWRALERPWRG